MCRFLVLLLSLLLTISCSDKQTDSRPILTVSIEPLRYVVEAIAGEHYRVVTLMPQGASPETYEPSPRQMIELDASKALFRVGTLGFEQTRLPQMTRSIHGLNLFDLNTAIQPIAMPHSCEHSTESADPHIWMSPKNLKKMAQNTYQSLCRINSTNTPYFKKRLKIFEQTIDSLDAELKTTLCNLSNRSFLIYHPALGYFARHYGLQQISVEHNGKEPSAAYLQSLINLCKARKVKVAFISEEHIGQTAQQTADAIGARVVRINPLAYNIADQLRFIAQQICYERNLATN